MSDEPVILTTDQALSMLPENDRIHTFRDTIIAMVGCDWERSDIEKAVRENKCEIGGKMCQAVNHGLVIHMDGEPLFVECKHGFDYAAFESSVLEARKDDPASALAGAEQGDVSSAVEL